MSQANGKLEAIFRVHAFDVAWTEVVGFPLDLDNLREVVALLKRWEGIRRQELVLGSIPMGNDNLIGVACMEIEVYYE